MVQCYARLAAPAEDRRMAIKFSALGNKVGKWLFDGPEIGPSPVARLNCSAEYRASRYAQRGRNFVHSTGPTFHDAIRVR